MSEEKYYFDFKTSFPAASAGDIVEIRFLYDFQGYSLEDFKIKSVDNTFCLLNELNVCHALGVWDTAPILKDLMYVKIIKPVDNAYLSFEIQNNKTGEIYKTPSRKLWRKGNYSSYIGLLNEKILQEPYMAGLAISSDNDFYIPTKKDVGILPVLLLAFLILAWVSLK